MYDPEPKKDAYHEYVELYHNESESSLNLSDWTLCGDRLRAGYVNRTDEELYANETAMIQPGSFALITDNTESGTWVYSNYSVSQEAIALHVDSSSTLCGGLTADEIIRLNNSQGDLINAVNLSPQSVTEVNESLQLVAGDWVAKESTPGSANEEEVKEKERKDNLTVKLAANDRFAGGSKEIEVVLDNRRGSFLQNVSLEVNLSANNSEAESERWNSSRQVSCPANSSLSLYFNPQVNEIGSYQVTASAELGNKSWTEDDEFAVLNLTNYSRKIELNEVLADPGSDRANYTEYIELYNPTERDIPFSGQIEENGGNHSFELELEGDGYGLVLTEERGNLTCANYSIREWSCRQLAGRSKLNNGGDNLTLWFGREKVEVDSYSYPQPEPEQAWSQDRADNEWELTEPSPGQENLITNNSGQSGVINHSLAQQLVINELLPDPGSAGEDEGDGGSKEFVEVYNPTSYDLRVEGFYLKDEVSERDELQGAIAARDYYVVNFSQVLNNGGDTVELYFNDSLVDEASYQESKEGKAKGRSPDGAEGGGWKWLQPTRGGQNPWIREREVEVENEDQQQESGSLTSAQTETFELANCPELVGSGSQLKLKGVFDSKKEREGELYSYAYDGHQLATEGGWTGNKKQVEIDEGWNLLQQENEIKENLTGNYTLKLKFKKNETEFTDSCLLTVKEEVEGQLGQGGSPNKNLSSKKSRQETKSSKDVDNKLKIVDYPRQLKAGTNYTMQALLKLEREGMLNEEGKLVGEHYSYVYDAGDLASEGGWKANPVQEEFERDYNLIESEGQLKPSKTGNFSLKLKVVNNSLNLSLADKVNIELVGRGQAGSKQGENGQKREGGELEGKKDDKRKAGSSRRTTNVIKSPNNFLERIIAFLSGLWG